jgi:Flp pilus assembly protein TadD
LARNLRYTGNAKLAAAELLKAPSFSAGDAVILLELGKAEIATGNAKDAVRHLQSAQKKDSGNWDVHGTLGVGFDLLKSYDKAQEAYAKALTLSPGNLSVLNNMAISLALSGKIDAAISTLEDAPISIRRMPQVRQNLALFYALKGDLKKAGTLAKMDLSEADARNNLAVFNRLRRHRPGPAKAK